MKKINLLLLLALSALTLQAQRYLSPVFDDVTVTADVTYGVNATVLLLSQFGEAVPQELVMDVYEPTGDDEVARPLVVIMHTGNFLPPTVNGGCTGTFRDATAVDLATRLAKMGYVVASAEYRLGWNPIADTQTERIFGIINAAYRGVQDSRTAIRYFKKTAAEDGNPFRVDTDKIVLWGIGTGGYISLASATIDTITDTQIPKFAAQVAPGVFIPMVNEPINGNVDGTTVGIVPPGFEAILPFPPGDTLNYPNHIGYDSEFQMSVNLGGALGDTSWIDANDVPTISFHVPTDPFAPCDYGLVLVPEVLLTVVDVAGSCAVQPIMVDEGTNAAIEASAPYGGPVSAEVTANYGGIESLYLFETEDEEDSAPWQYATSLTPYGVPGSDCDTMSAVSSLYLDTIVNYFAPRAYAVLALPAAAYDLIPADEVGLKIAPNPATSQVLIQTDAEFPISDMQLFDLSGRMLEQRTNVQNNQIRMDRNNLPAGIYVVKLRIKDRVVAQKLVFN